MFYTYVKDLPMVTDNLILNRGGRLEFSCGHLRKASADSRGFRAWVIHDKNRDVSYRVTEKGMLIEFGIGYDYSKVFIPNIVGGIRHTNFAVEGDAAEVNSFLSLLGKMGDEYQYRRSITARIKNFLKEPVGKIFLLASIVYAIITFIVVVFG